MATELRHASPVADAIGMAALVLLTRCLPGHTKLRGDLRPSDSLADGSVDEHRQLCLGIVSLDPDLPDLLQHLGRGQLGDSLRRARLPRGCRIAPVRPRLPGSRDRLVPRLAHQSSMRIGRHNRVPREPHRYGIDVVYVTSSSILRALADYSGLLWTPADTCSRRAASRRQLHASGTCCTVVGRRRWHVEGGGLKGPGAPTRSDRSFLCGAARITRGFRTPKRLAFRPCGQHRPPPDSCGASKRRQQSVFGST